MNISQHEQLPGDMGDIKTSHTMNRRGGGLGKREGKGSGRNRAAGVLGQQKRYAWRHMDISLHERWSAKAAGAVG